MPLYKLSLPELPPIYTIHSLIAPLHIQLLSPECDTLCLFKYSHCTHHGILDTYLSMVSLL